LNKILFVKPVTASDRTHGSKTMLILHETINLRLLGQRFRLITLRGASPSH